MLTAYNAQSFEKEVDPFTITENGQVLMNTFSGGTNNIEHQFIDIDADGDLDLFYLCSDGAFEWLENKGTIQNADFVLSLQPVNGLLLNGWFYFADMDADQDLDLFTGMHGNFIRYLENTGTKFSPQFIVAVDTLKDINGSPILSESNSNPAFGDLDGDGDLDYFSGNQSGKVLYYENIGTVNNFSFRFITNFWQNIQITGGGVTEHHGANSLEFADIDGDEDKDLFWGDFFSRSVYFIENNGTVFAPDMNLIYDFYPPNGDSLLTRGFNMPRLADIDGDNDLDLFVSVLFDPTEPETIIYFENTGQIDSPNFTRISGDYISTLDAGTKSIPAFIDIDKDSDLDMFIGTENNPEGSILFYKNIGNVTKPNFDLVDSAFAGIHGPLSLAPCFGDMDGDGDYDLLVGTLLGRIEFYRNIGSPQNADFSFEGNLKDNSNTEITFSNFARPRLVDLDNDNKLDLVLGSFNGLIRMYKNIGTEQIYEFVLDEQYFSGIDVGGQSYPFLIDYDNNGSLDLFCGSRDGKIYYFNNTSTSSSPNFVLTDSTFINYNFGLETVPNFVDIDNDGDKDLFVGNMKGGLYFYRNLLVSKLAEDENVLLPSDIEISAYPNPFNSQVSLRVKINKKNYYSIKIYNILGRKVFTLYAGILKQGISNFNWDSSNSGGTFISSGIYFITVTNNYIVNSLPIFLIK